MFTPRKVVEIRPHQGTSRCHSLVRRLSIWLHLQQTGDKWDMHRVVTGTHDGPYINVPSCTSQHTSSTLPYQLLHVLCMGNATLPASGGAVPIPIVALLNQAYSRSTKTTNHSAETD